MTIESPHRCRQTLTTLLLTHISSLMPTATHHAYMCSAGSQGYHALKEMLQNGTPGNTLLIESSDLRDLDDSTNLEDASATCLLVYMSEPGESCPAHNYHQHLPHTTHHQHIQFFTNQLTLPRNFLESCSQVATVDMSAIPPYMSKIPVRFLVGCSGLLSPIDLTPLLNITDLREYFLSGCTSLTEIDMRPLSNVTRLHKGFLKECSGLKSIDLSPLTRLTKISEVFLEGCSGLTTFDLAPLMNLSSSTIPPRFLSGCSGLKSIDLSPLSTMKNVVGLSRGFLESCSGLTDIDLTPLAYLKRPLPPQFMPLCTGLTSVDFTPLAASSTLPLGLFYGCTGLTTLDLSPLAHLTKLPPDLLIWSSGEVRLILPPHLGNKSTQDK